eukprot:4130177-Pleurochrysis_carterae.AAC.1
MDIGDALFEVEATPPAWSPPPPPLAQAGRELGDDGADSQRPPAHPSLASTEHLPLRPRGVALERHHPPPLVAVGRRQLQPPVLVRMQTHGHGSALLSGSSAQNGDACAH